MHKHGIYYSRASGNNNLDKRDIYNVTRYNYPNAPSSNVYTSYHNDNDDCAGRIFNQ